MLAFSLAVCNHLVHRTSFRLICSNFVRNCSVSLPHGVFDLNSNRNALDITRPGVTFAANYLSRLSNPDDVQWDDLIKKLQNLKVKNPSTKILQACIRLKEVDLALNFYNYMVEKGEELSLLDIFFFCKLLGMRKEVIPQYEELLIKLYDNIKNYVGSSTVIRNFILDTLVEVPSIFSDIIKIPTDGNMGSGNQAIVLKALELNMVDVALRFASDYDFNTCTEFLDQYISFCIRRLEEGNFSIDYINQLVNICAEKAICLNHNCLLTPLQNLVDALGKHQNEYSWSVKQCKISADSVCSHCNLKLLPKGVTEEEFQELRKHFYEKSFVQNIYLKTSREELEKFLQFLDRTQPYNLVIDALNLLYKDKLVGTTAGNRYIKYFIDKGYRVLCIGRKHARGSLTKAFMHDKKYKGNAQFFFTDNSSEDDLFLLQAALHGGLNTYFITGDLLTAHSAQLQDNMRINFIKWQASHQYLLKENFDVSSPLPHCGLPQLTNSEDGCYVWHLSQQTCNKFRMSILHPINWYCLKAEKKK